MEKHFWAGINKESNCIYKIAIWTILILGIGPLTNTKQNDKTRIKPAHNRKYADSANMTKKLKCS